MDHKFTVGFLIFFYCTLLNIYIFYVPVLEEGQIPKHCIKFTGTVSIVSSSSHLHLSILIYVNTLVNYFCSGKVMIASQDIVSLGAYLLVTTFTWTISSIL